MITTREEVRRSIAGALLLARGDAAGMGAFELSVDGFWRSFAAPILAAPLYAFLLAEQYLRMGMADGLGRVLLVESVSYALDIVSFPILAIFLTRFLGLGARYVPLVIATNWATLPQVALFAGAVLVGGAIPPFRPMLLMTALFATLIYQWFVIRTALASTGSIAAACVLLNLLVGIMLHRALDGLL